MKPLNAETKEFILSHKDDDIPYLALHRPKSLLIDFDEAIVQIAGYKKAKHKLPQIAANNNIRFPQSLPLEQCSSEITAAFKPTLLAGETLIDLTGGFGIDSMAFSKQFKKVIYVEQNAELCELMRHNCSVLSITNIEIVNSDAELFLNETSPADVIYLDPARRNQSGGKVFRLEECSPNIIQLLPLLVRKAKNGIIAKISPIADIKSTMRLLPSISSFHIVSVKNECKEVLCVVDFKNGQTTSPIITAVELSGNDNRSFSFTLTEEAAAVPIYTDKVMTYLYEPLNCVLKSGAFKLLSTRYNLRKLHLHTHLYTSDNLLDETPCNIYKVENSFSFSKKDLKEYLRNITDCTLKIRNFPLSVDALSKKLKIGMKGEGKQCIFATTLANGEHMLILASRINIS